MIEFIITVIIIAAVIGLLMYINDKFSLDRRLQRSSQQGTPEEQQVAQEIQRQITQGHTGLGG